jgi:signal transduction histidine kinase
LPDSDATINTDQTKLIQVLSNLVNNAIKFTTRGFVRFGYNVKDSYLEFYVEDSGIGITDEMHEEIFIRFRQVENELSRDYGGAGLGLSISKAYVELLGGKIWVTSELEKGSVFSFTIPFKRVRSVESNHNQSIKEEIDPENSKFF